MGVGPDGMPPRGGMSSHPIGCVCLNCQRRKQLLYWRDTMIDAQRHFDYERGRVRAVALINEYERGDGRF